MLAKERDLLKPLTGIRAVAAYLIFIHHYNIFANKYPGSIIALLAGELHIGLPLFFILTGFLITYRYYHRRKEILSKRFYIKRFARIYPLFFILVTATYLFAYMSGDKSSTYSLTNYFYNITFVSGFFNELKFTGIAQAWSLTPAEMFYLFTPMIFFFMKKNLLNLIGLVIGFMMVGSLIVFFSSEFSNPYGFFDSLEFMFTFTFFGRCFEFLTGAFIAVYYLRHKEALEKQKTHFLTYVGILSILACMIVLINFPEEGDNFTIRFLTYSILLPIIGYAPLYIGLITSKTIFSRVLSSKPLQVLGRSSYAFYLIHLGFIASALQAISGNHIIFFILLILAAIVLHYAIEKPFNKKIRSSFIH